jgi:UDP-N-acetylglucosamine acyltransferase
MNQTNQKYSGNIIDPTALIADGVVMGTGNIIGPYCVIGYPPEWKGKEHNIGKVVIGNNNRFTGMVTIDSGAEHNTIIGDGCYLMKGVYIAHDCYLADGVTIASGGRLGGHVIVAEQTTIGINASVHQRSIIPTGCMIGMGAVITKTIKMQPYRKYAGVPAIDIGDNSAHFPSYTINEKQYPE